jgi:hypothetical protein
LPLPSSTAASYPYYSAQRPAEEYIDRAWQSGVASTELPHPR